MKRKDFEIMAPVGSYESLHAAIAAGADAIYFGVEGLNMRARSSVNFTLDDLRRIAGICDAAGVKSYLTVNTIMYDDDVEKCHAIIDAVARLSALQSPWPLTRWVKPTPAAWAWRCISPRS